MSDKEKAERLKTLLCNALDLYSNETLSQYENSVTWVNTVLKDLSTTKEELKELGIMFEEDGDWDVMIDTY